MKILFIGDIVGRSGREAVEAHLPTIREKHSPDLVIINAENAAHGFGLTEKVARGLFDLGADCLTTGNHVWDQREIISYITREPRIIRAATIPDPAPGKGVLEGRTHEGERFVVIHLMGRVFMDAMECPFRTADRLLKDYRLGKNCDTIFVDFHGEATSEKMALGQYLDGRVSAVVGTHTHIPTADCQIFNGGTAYQTDAGMTGDYDSVIGMKKDVPIFKFVRKMPTERMSPASGEATLCGTLIETKSNGLAVDIRPIRIGGRLKPSI